MKFFLILLTIFSICSCNFTPKDVKSPCVSISNFDGTPSPCIKRNANDRWIS